MSIGPRTPTHREIKDYYDAFLSHLVNDRFTPNLRHHAVGNIIKDNIRPDDRVLDLGCGIGVTTEMVRHVTPHVLGVDVSERLIQYAEQTVGGRFLCADIPTLKLQETFNRILLFDCLEHIPLNRHEDLFATLAGLAEPDAKIILTIPHPHFAEFVRRTEPASQQILDESLDLSHLISAAWKSDWQVDTMERFGVEFEKQYCAVAFVRPDKSAPARHRPTFSETVWKAWHTVLWTLSRPWRSRKYWKPYLELRGGGGTMPGKEG